MSARQASGWWSQRLKIWGSRRRDQIADHKRQRSRRSFLESLEPRHLMATVPVAVPDPWYSTPLNTDLVVTGGGTTLIANDFDAESLSLSASIVANPSHGTIVSSTSGGLFTYRPTTGYTGLDSFTYKVSNSTFDSNVATVSIAVGDNFGPRRNEDISPLNGMLMSGALTLTQPLTMGLNLVYRSDTALLKPIVVVETSLQSGSTVPNSIDAQLTFGGVTGSVVSYTNSGLAAGDTLRFALAADASSLTTGMHDWSMCPIANSGR